MKTRFLVLVPAVFLLFGCAMHRSQNGTTVEMGITLSPNRTDICGGMKEEMDLIQAHWEHRKDELSPEKEAFVLGRLLEAKFAYEQYCQ